MKFNITNETWLSLLFFLLMGISVFYTLTENYYGLQHLAIDIEATMVLLASIFYKEEVRDDEDSTPA